MATMPKRSDISEYPPGCTSPPHDKTLHQEPILAINSLRLSSLDCLQHRTGPMEVKFKVSAFTTWSSYFIRLEGHWLCVYKREQDSCRVGGIELGSGVQVAKCPDEGFVQKSTTQINIMCSGGRLSKFELKLRAKSISERDDWIAAIRNNIYLLRAHAKNPMYGLTDLTHVLSGMRNGLQLQVARIDNQSSVKCAQGSDIVKFFIAESFVTNDAQAIKLGRRLVFMNYLHHISWSKDFVDGTELFVVTASSDTNCILRHFQKALDGKRFWKYIDPNVCSLGMENDDNNDHASLESLARCSLLSGKAEKSSILMRNRSTSGVGFSMHRRIPDAGLTYTDDDENLSTLEAHCSHGDPESQRKAKKCTKCKRTFNPLRRRYECQGCKSIVCGNCSITKKMNALTESMITRICAGCKFDALHGNGSSTKVEDSTLFSSARIDEERSDYSSASNSFHVSKEVPIINHLSDKYEAASNNILPVVDHCSACMDRDCGPLSSTLDVPYPCYKQRDDRHEREFLVAKEAENERARLNSVNILIKGLENHALLKVLDRMVSMAAIATQCPMAAIGILEDDKYSFVSKENVPGPAIIERNVAFASHTCGSAKPLICSDLSFDCRFADNPWRCEQSFALFYAGIPLHLENGHIVGAFEVYDSKARFGCSTFVDTLQAIVRGVSKKLNEVFNLQQTDGPPQRCIAQRNLSEPIPNFNKDAHDGCSRESEDCSFAADQGGMIQSDLALAGAQSVVSISTTSSTSSITSIILSQSDMEQKLIELLNQTTSTQEQIRNQQGHMVHAISKHSVQIKQLAQQLEQMEQTLVAKLGTNQELED